MNKIFVSISVLVFTVASATWVGAQDNDREFVPMLYMQVPFGGSKAIQEESSYGMALVTKDPIQAGTEISAPINLLDSSNPRLLDMRFKQDGFDSLKLNGVSLVQRVVTHNVDGTTTENTTTNLSTEQLLMIGLGVGLVLCAADVICDDKGGDTAAAPPADDVVVADAVE